MKGLTEYQRGSIFGMTMVALAFAFALWGQPHNEPTLQKAEQRTAAPSEQDGKNPVSEWWGWTTEHAADFYTFGLVVIGSAQAIFFIWQLVLIREGLADTKQAADAATEQAKLARESLIANQRAWIKMVNIEMIGSLKLSNSQSRVTIKFNTINIGNSIALKVTPWIRLGFIENDGMQIERFHKECSEIVNIPPAGESPVFPGETFPPEPHSSVYVAHSKRNALEKAIMKISGSRYVTPLLLICILYKFPTDPTRYHQTRMALVISRKDGAIIDAEPGVLPVEELSISHQSWEGSFYAD